MAYTRWHMDDDHVRDFKLPSVPWPTGMCLFPTEDQIAEAVLGPGRKREWRNIAAFLEARCNLPKAHPFYGRRYWPDVVICIHLHLHGEKNGVRYGLPPAEDRPETVEQRYLRERHEKYQASRTPEARERRMSEKQRKAKAREERAARRHEQARIDREKLDSERPSKV